MSWWENAEAARASMRGAADANDREVADLEGDPVYPTTEPGRDLLAELQASVERARA